MNKQIYNAVKWSGLTEVIAKLITPVTSMVLARLLAPEMFGVVASITMITSLADIFSDAGFQKYLIQKEFKSEEELHRNANVAFWTNLLVSVGLWLLVIVFSKQLTIFMGSAGLETELIVACASLPLTSFSSIQIALYRRDFDFKTLFINRIAVILVPVFVTIPLAILWRNYWSLIVGTILVNVVNAVILTIRSKWKPKLFFKLSLLKEMASFSIWTLFEQVVTWLTNYADIFIVGKVLSTYWLGIYKTSMTTVNHITNIVVMTITPVLFSALSRVQNDDSKFKETFLSFQQKISMLIMPLGVGILLHKELVTHIFLGSQWGDAITFVGIWGVTSSIAIVLGQFCSEAFRAKGKPWLSCIVQVIALANILIVVSLFVNEDFTKLAYARSFVRLLGTIVNVVMLQVFVKISIKNMLASMKYATSATVLMVLADVALGQISDGVIWEFFVIVIDVVVYFGTLLAFPEVRKQVLQLDFFTKFFGKLRRNNDK